MKFSLGEFALILLAVSLVGCTVTELEFPEQQIKVQNYTNLSDVKSDYEEYYDYRLSFSVGGGESCEVAKLKILSWLRGEGYRYDNESITFSHSNRTRIPCEFLEIAVSKEKDGGISPPGGTIENRSHSSLPYSMYHSVSVDPKVQKIPGNESDIVSCQEDRECIRVIPSGCCGCSGAGGNAKAINRVYYDYWTKQDRCESYCPAIGSDHWTCRAGEPICINGTCSFIEPP